MNENPYESNQQFPTKLNDTFTKPKQETLRSKSSKRTNKSRVLPFDVSSTNTKKNLD